MLNLLLGEQQPQSLKLPSPVPLALHPAAVYLDSLGSVSSRAAMLAGLDIMAKLLTGGEKFIADFLELYLPMPFDFHVKRVESTPEILLLYCISLRDFANAVAASLRRELGEGR